MSKKYKSYTQLINHIDENKDLNEYTINTNEEFVDFVSFLTELLKEMNTFRLRYKIHFFELHLNNIFSSQKNIINELEQTKKIYYYDGDEYYSSEFLDSSYYIFERNTQEIVLFWDAILQKLYLRKDYGIALENEGVSNKNYFDLIRETSVSLNWLNMQSRDFLETFNLSFDLNMKYSYISKHFYEEEFQYFIQLRKIRYAVYPYYGDEKEIKNKIKSFNLNLDIKYNQNFLILKNPNGLSIDIINKFYDLNLIHDYEKLLMILVEDEEITDYNNFTKCESVYYVYTEESFVIWQHK